MAAPTRVGEAGGSRNLTGAPPPQKRFSLGLHPVSLGKTKEMGWNRQHQRKVQQDKTASSAQPNPTPGRRWNPAPTRGFEERGEVGGGRRKGSSRTPTPTAGGKRTACRRIYCEIIPRPGRGGRNTVRLAKTVTAGRRGRRPLRGGCGDVGLAVIQRPGGRETGRVPRAPEYAPRLRKLFAAMWCVSTACVGANR